MKKALAVALAFAFTLAFAFLASPADAQRPFVPAMTCAQAAGLVRSAGAIVLSTGRYTYDRFVAEDGYCLPEDVAKPAFERTLDNPSCLIGYYCAPRMEYR